jgi:RND family efflux transporter MFP subunit
MDSKVMACTRYSSLLALALLTTLSLACSKSAADNARLPADSTPQPVPVRVVHPTAHPNAGDTRVTATIRSKSEATLSAKTTAQILDLPVRVGDPVKKGQVLARLDASMPSISLQNARAAERLASANLANARLELDRGKALHDQGALADAAFDKIKMAFDIASAQLDQARAAVRASSQQVADSTIVAPFDGVVSARFKNPGDTVSLMPPTPILSLVDPARLEVRITVPEALASLLHHGDVLAATASPSSIPFHVRVSALGSAVDPMSRTVEILADLIPPVDPLLRPGTLATIDLATALSLQALFVPASVVHTSDGASFVYLAADGRLLRKPVTASPIKPGVVLVAQGLSPADAVVVDATGLHDGDAVRILAD